MKFCLTYWQQPSLLEEADEIKVLFRDRAILPELYEKYPTKTFILSLFPRKELEIDWTELNNYNTLSRGKLILEAYESWEIIEADKNNIPVYSGNPVTTFYQAKTLIGMNVCYLLVDAPLFFNLGTLKILTDCPVRAIPNIANKDNLVHEDGVLGSWIRPEDLELYKNVIDTIEFTATDDKQEATLFDIYKHKKTWPVRLDIIVSDLGHPAVNRLILKKAMEKRLNCGQHCVEDGMCHSCYRALDMANTEFVKKATASMRKTNAAKTQN